MQIKKNDLLDIIDILKDQVSSNFDDTIEIDSEDFYWQILSPNELYDPTHYPKELGLGQISDDWEELSRLQNEDEIPISYDLKRLAVILEIVRNKSIGKW
ncbi:MAG: hypothetical protein AAFQ78_00375 [Bacteroidota bacterium]